MKVRQIPLKTWEVQAILDGRKIQTRRVVKPKHEPLELEPNEWLINLALCPYGQPGDVLIVRETFAHTSQLNINPEDENYGYVYKADGQPWDDCEWWKWKHSIHMPREAARLFLRIKSVRVERLHEISEDDAIREGIGRFTKDNTIYKYGIDGWPWREMQRKPSLGFRFLWQSINGPESWDENPFVWVIEFEKIQKESVYLGS
jgi:hypothetical protein